jgi:hypothetical protein
MKKLILSIGVIGLLTTSCSTVFNGSYQTVQFKSSTNNAKVMVNTRELGKTNEDIKIKRSDLDGLYRISKEGCVTKEMELKLKPTIASLCGAAISPFLPLIGPLVVSIDLSSQNNLKTDEVINVELDCTKK